MDSNKLYICYMDDGSRWGEPEVSAEAARASAASELLEQERFEASSIDDDIKMIRVLVLGVDETLTAAALAAILDSSVSYAAERLKSLGL